MSNVDQTFGFISKLPELEEPLSAGNYSEKFKTLLYAEEHQMMVDIRRYDRKGVTMTPSKKYDRLLNLSVSDKKKNSFCKGSHSYSYAIFFQNFGL